MDEGVTFSHQSRPEPDSLTSAVRSEPLVHPGARPTWRAAPRLPRSLWSVAAFILTVGIVLLAGGIYLPAIGGTLRDFPACLALSAAVHLVQLALTAMAWQALLPPTEAVTLRWMTLVRAFRESAAIMLPGGALLGQAEAARLLCARGLPGPVAAATAMVDVSVEAASQGCVTILGILLLFGRDGRTGPLPVLELGAVVAAFSALTLGMLQIARSGPVLGRVTERVQQRLPRRWQGHVTRLLAAIQLVQARRDKLLLAMLCHGSAWSLGALEVAGVLALTGHEISLRNALIVETVAQAIRVAGIMLPGAAGVQEGALVAAGLLVDVPAAAGLTLALVRRGREICFALPGPLFWKLLHPVQTLPTGSAAVGSASCPPAAD